MLTAATPYQVLGIGIPKLLARSDDRNKIMRLLGKPIPDHVSLVGPRYIGKTVFLHDLADTFVADKSSVAAIIYWDLRHNTPKSDPEFYRTLGDQLQPLISKLNNALATFLDDSAGTSFYHLKSLFETLSEDRITLLVILDGLDPVLQNPEITKNLWDSLRALADMSSFRMVTGTRQPLRELCLSAESKTSDFFNIFAMNVVRLGPLSDKDSDDFLVPLESRGITLDTAAKSVFRGWCGGIPLLTAALCLDLWNAVADGQVLASDFIDERAELLYSDESVKDILYDFFWRDCSEQERATLAEIVRGFRTDRAVTEAGVQPLIQKGFLASAQNNLVCPSRLLNRYASEQGESVTRLRSLFGTPAVFEENAPALLELRLSQLGAIDETLRSHIQTIINYLDKPAEGAKLIRLVSDRAYSVVLENEVPSGELPQQWINEWKNRGLDKIPDKKVPVVDDRKGRYKLLQNMADTRYALQNRRLTQDLQLLLAHMKLLGDFGFHPGTRIPSASLMFTVCITAIEIAKQLRETYA